MQIYGNTLFAGNVKGLVDIYDLQNHSKGQPFHNTSSLGASKKNFKELMEARVNWIYFVEGFLLVLIKDSKYH
jgi:thioester reductase-like protein